MRSYIHAVWNIGIRIQTTTLVHSLAVWNIGLSNGIVLEAIPPNHFGSLILSNRKSGYLILLIPILTIDRKRLSGEVPPK